MTEWLEITIQLWMRSLGLYFNISNTHLNIFSDDTSWPAFVLKDEIVEDGVRRRMYKEEWMIFADSENMQEQNLVVPTSSFEIISVCTYL
jgi:hypothetical protein